MGLRSYFGLDKKKSTEKPPPRRSGAEPRKVVDLYGHRHSEDQALSEVERIRQRRYLVRAHYASPGVADDGVTDCPLYYASIEGLGGESTQNIAALKQLPKQGAPGDYRMVDVANVVPEAVGADVGCILNGFKLDRVKVLVEGVTDEERTKLCKEVMQESEQRACTSLRGLIFSGASRGDVYVRVKKNPAFRTGISVQIVPAEGVFPQLSIWNENMAEAYRLVFQGQDAEVDADPSQAPGEVGVWKTFVERIDAQGVEVRRDGERVEKLCSKAQPGLDELPMVHIGHRECDSFFGTPAVDSGVVSAIDFLNVQWSNLGNVLLQSFGVPVLFIYGASGASNLSWGRRMVKGLPKDAKAELLGFKDFDKLLKVIEECDKNVRQRVPQLVLSELRNASSVQSGVALLMRLYVYSAYLESVAHQYAKGIGDIYRIVLKLLGKWPQDKSVTVEVDWGPWFPQDVKDKVEELKSQLATFGKIKPVIERAAREAGYSPKDIKAIVRNLERDNEADLKAKETSAEGGGVGGAAMARSTRDQKQVQRGAKKTAAEASGPAPAPGAPAPQAGGGPAPGEPKGGLAGALAGQPAVVAPRA